MKTLNEKLSYMQANFKSKKSRFNSFGKYNFRSAEDILESIKPYLTELNVSVRIEEEYVEGRRINNTSSWLNLRLRRSSASSSCRRAKSHIAFLLGVVG